MTEERRNKRRRIHYRDTVAVYVGPDQQLFTLHADVVTSHSKFFRAALSNGFKETEEKAVKLADIDVNLFEVYVQWAYTGEIVAIDETDDPNDDPSYGKHYCFLINMYAVANRLEDTQFRNAVMTSMVRFEAETKKFPNPAAISKAFISTPEGSTVRRFIVDKYLALLNNWVPKWLKNNRCDLPEDFIFDMAHGAMLSAAEMAVQPASRPKCYYHDHDGDASECK